MKPITYYECKNILRETNDLNEIIGTSYSFIPELPTDYITVEDCAKNKRVIIKVLLDICTDGIRVIKVKTVWYRKQPVMIVRCAGRAGRDSYDRFITNIQRYRDMVEYLRSILPADKISEDVVVGQFYDVPALDKLYGSYITELIKFEK